MLALLLLLLFGFPSAHAQTTPPDVASPEVVASVNVYNAAVKPNAGNKSFRVSFDISNREGSQPQIKYGLSLTKHEKTADILIDQHVYPETLSLTAGQTVHKVITYTPPEYLNGAYQLWVESRNANGLVFAIVPAGDITLKGDNDYLEIQNSACYLTVKGETPPQKYNLNQGVDIAADETLIIHCPIKNHFSRPLTVQPTFALYRRTTFGAPSGNKSLAPITLQGGQQQSIALDIPKPSYPQAYDAVLSFTDTALGEPISNTVIAHFVLRGESATIQNVVFDKASYHSGDTAKVTLTFTPSADVFPQSRGAGTSIPRLAMNLVVRDADRQTDCSPVLNRALDTSHDQQVFSLAMITDCSAPVIAVSLADSQGKVLDQGTFSQASGQQLASPPSPPSASPSTPANPDTAKTWLTRGSTLLIIVIIVLVALVIGLFYFSRIKKDRDKGKRTRNISKLSVLFFAVLAGSLFTQSVARADTFSMGYLEHGYDWVVSYFSASVNKQTYHPGEPIIASGAGWGGRCVNGYRNLVERTFFPSGKGVVLFYYDNYGGPSYLAGKASDPAPQKPGKYTVRFLGAGYGYRHSPRELDIPITVVAPNTPPTLNLSSPALVSVLKPVQLTWQSTNADTCTASGDWSGSKAVTGAESITKARGNYTFNLTCTGAGGSVSKTVNVKVVQCSFSGVSPIHNLPQPSFNWSPKSILPNQTVTFDASGTVFAPGATGRTYNWRWSGGQPLTPAAGPSTNPITTNKFASANSTTTVTLTAADNAGTCWVSDTLNVKSPLPHYQEIKPTVP